MKIGFEIHVQLRTASKLFCSCPTDYWKAEPNTNVCPVCTGLPGSKPLPVNREALEKALLVAIALGMEIKDRVIFLRKHYFYPDLPSGYQRTSTPLGVNGNLEGVRIREIHLEEDPGRYELREGLVDFNRSGVPLVEIVTEPDMKSVEEAEHFLKKLHHLLTYLDVVLNPSVVFRVDANISLEGGERVEIKNINTIEGVKKALSYEILRQKRLLSLGKSVERETRHWDDVRGVTVSLRTKETEEDYRYMPDPDIPPVLIEGSLVESVKERLPELPWEREKRFIGMGVDPSKAHALVLERDLADYFERHVKEIDPKFWSDFLADRLRGELNYRSLSFSEVSHLGDDIFRIAGAWWEGKITKEVAVELLRGLLDGNVDNVSSLIEELSSPVEVSRLVEEVLQELSSVVEDYRSGKKNALNRLVGEVMKRSRGRADPRKVREEILRRLGE